MSIAIRAADWEQDRDLLRAVRDTVFIQEQNVPIELEWDEHDTTASHWLAMDNEKAIGTCRMLGDGHIGRMAVLPNYRQQGIGRLLLQSALQQARINQYYEVYLYAQTHAIDFYQREGFTTYGEEFLDAGIPHLSMRKQIAEHRLLGLHGGNFAINNHPAEALQLIQQCSKYLRILSYDLDPKTFDTDAMADCISALARKSRYSEIRILIVDSHNISRRGHRLLNLHRRLSSNILLRRTNAAPHDIKNNLIIADLYAMISQSIKEPEKCWGNYNNKPVTNNHIVWFDDLWQRASEDKNLRLLEI
ncbi:GNAT family N-acetyltransferase [Oceanicoccus sp. KOV_DT_Chl]|uniref:GNAT family N-acetyltransferase n=1 Tax=Oceanicoccus sp. KOV_DT_Chl TaxID=1904639 RepID=UPI000C7D0A0A|nr:GNAT family N-acetyltransferase [Oceanicoccus sp. KOV_DT_Chl]